MENANQIERLLIEIRDLLARSDDQKYEEYVAKDAQNYERYLAKIEQMSKGEIEQARRRAMLTRPLQWLTLGVVVYFAVLSALRSADGAHTPNAAQSGISIDHTD